MTALLLALAISVPANGDLQAAIDRAKPGETIELEAGATYTGHFTLPVKDGDAVTTITTAGAGKRMPQRRVTPADAAMLAKLRTPDQDPAIQAAPGAHHWRVLLVEVQGSDDGDLVSLGAGSHEQTIAAQVPHDLVLDRIFVHGDAAKGRRRGISLNSAATTVTRSYVSDIKAMGRDAQAICGWNGPGPFTISDNYLEGSTENIMFGGADPGIANLVPADITITGNTIAKAAAWKQERWEVKNLLELKNARHVLIKDNLLEYNWQQAQSGFAVLFTVRNQDGACPWCEVSDVVFEDNLVQHSGGAISILGVDNNHPSKQTRGIVIRSNVFADIDNQRWGGNGYALQITDGPKDITFDRNTIVQDHGAGFLQVEGPPIPGFVFTNNVVRHLTYGVAGRDRAPGGDSLSAYFPNGRVTGNVIADGDGGHYPGGNTTPSWQDVCRDPASVRRKDPDVFQERAIELICRGGSLSEPWKQLHPEPLLR
jgi:hypothetical protein